MKYYILVIFLILNIQISNSQIKKKHTDGIYLNFEQFKKNSPVTKANIVTSLDFNSYAFFDNILKNDVFYIYDNIGGKIKIITKDIWGYCNNGLIFIKYNDEFNRIPVLGKISHFVAYKTYTYTNTDPFTDPYYNRYKYEQNNRTELRKYILDYETGKIYDLNYKTLSKVLEKDSIIHKEYKKLSRRKKNKKVFFYIRKYNKKHPIDIVD